MASPNINLSRGFPRWASVASEGFDFDPAFPSLHQATRGQNQMFQTPFSKRNMAACNTPLSKNKKKGNGKKGSAVASANKAPISSSNFNMGVKSANVLAANKNQSEYLKDVRDEYGSQALSKKIVDRVVIALPDGPDEDAECRRMWVVLVALMHNGFKANVDLVLKRYAEMFSRKRGGRWSSTLERKLRKCPGMMLLGEGPSATIQVNKDLMNSYHPPLIDYTKMPEHDYHSMHLKCVTQSAMRAQCRMAGIFGLGETIMDMPSTKYWLPPGHRLAECCNMIHVCVVEKYLGYDDNGHLVPYPLSNSAIQDKLAELHVPTMRELDCGVYNFVPSVPVFRSIVLKLLLQHKRILVSMFKQMISDCSKLRLSETLLGYAKVLPLIENCCSFGEIIVVGGGAKAIALHQNYMPDHPVWQGSLAETNFVLQQRNLLADGKDPLAKFMSQPPVLRMQSVSKVYSSRKELSVPTCELWEHAITQSRFENRAPFQNPSAKTFLPAARLQSSQGIPESGASPIPIVQHQNDGLPFPKSSYGGYTDQWALSYLTSGAEGLDGATKNEPNADSGSGYGNSSGNYSLGHGNGLKLPIPIFGGLEYPENHGGDQPDEEFWKFLETPCNMEQHQDRMQFFAPAVDEMLSQQQHRRDYVGSTDLPATLPPNAAELYSENPAAFAQALEWFQQAMSLSTDRATSPYSAGSPGGQHGYHLPSGSVANHMPDASPLSGLSPHMNESVGSRWDRPMDAQSPMSRWGMHKRDSTGNEPRTHYGHVDFGDQRLPYSYGADRCLRLDQVDRVQSPPRSYSMPTKPGKFK